MTTFPAPVWGQESQCNLAGRILRQTSRAGTLAITNGIAKPRANQCRVPEWSLLGISSCEGLELFLGLGQILRTVFPLTAGI
jgi:hypothetical protein